MSTIRANVLKMQPYSPGKPIADVQRELGLTDVVKLASNENPLGPSPKAIAAVTEAARQMHIYPDGAAVNLKNALAEHFGIGIENLMVGNGSDELIHLLGLVFLDSPEDEIVVGNPSFVRYDAAAELAPSRLVRVPLTPDYRHDLPAMARAVSDKTKLVFIANPNNPTGTIVTKRELDEFLDSIPSHVVTVLDEAYFEFAAHVSDYPNSLDYVKAGRNVIGLRTFSKTYGLAGIRLGYGFAPQWVVNAIDRAREPFNTNSLAQVAAIAALNDEDHIRATVAINETGLKRISSALEKAGFTPCESYANFVFAECHRPAKPIFEALLREGVIIRGGDAFGCPTCVRVSVGTPEEVSKFEQAMERISTGVSV
ncbi:MAG TPA: histidinol-phosphate transaminase [Fimbriimonadaceae bacterium]|nr:histidinol-phosphate transaminase [Fimbriimonadaceae bacterium]